MKLRLTALSISSMDMNTVMMFRRNRKPATPRANRTALRVKNHDIGICVISVHFLSRQNDGANDRDQDEDGSDFEGEQVGGEQGSADLFRAAPAEPAEMNGRV